MTGKLVEPTDYASFCRRIIRSLGQRVGDADPESLRYFQELRDLLTKAEDRAMVALTEAGYSCAEMARVLGVTRQAVHQRVQRTRSAQ
jgi:DNA-directed RNA polymerase specialized sigma24 family protein